MKYLKPIFVIIVCVPVLVIQIACSAIADIWRYIHTIGGIMPGNLAEEAMEEFERARESLRGAAVEWRYQSPEWQRVSPPAFIHQLRPITITLASGFGSEYCPPAVKEWARFSSQACELQEFYKVCWRNSLCKTFDIKALFERLSEEERWI